jgi:RNA polymerase sigma factor (sigma-70 family)
MPSPRLSATVAWAGRAALAAGPDTTDGRLLARFVQARDDAAFGELVRRLGPMVLGVCRRVTGDAHLAEDAFQAAFLVLARRAADVRPREAVRGWLYGVAVRTAQKARTMSARRRARETPVAALPDCPATAHREPDPDALRALDEEIAALPEHLRAAVVLCELEGVARKHAAARLGIPEGTLSSRLGKARQVLAERLRKRGVVLPAGLAMALGQLASAAVPPRLASATTALASASVPVSPAVAVLSRGVLRTMFLTKLNAVVLVGLLLAAGGWAALPAGSAAPEGPPLAPTPAGPTPLAIRPDDNKPRPVAKAVGPGTLLLTRERGLVILTPDGKEQAELIPPEGARSNHHGRLSPDGTRAAFVVNRGKPRGPNDNLDAPWPIQVIVQKIGAADAKAVDFPGFGVSLCWTPDGKRLAVTKFNKDRQVDENIMLDPETGQTEPLDLPAGAEVLDWSRDGNTLLVIYLHDKKFRLGLAAKDDKEPRELTDLKVRLSYHVVGRFSPDGKKILFADADPEQTDAHKWHRSSTPHVLDVATRKREPLAEFPENAECLGAAWSPDGKRVAYTWVQLHPDLLKKDVLNIADVQIPTEGFLIVADADGRNQKTVASARCDNAINPIYGSVDWR